MEELIFVNFIDFFVLIGIVVAVRIAVGVFKIHRLLGIV
jgi:hypothetical protein